MKRAGVSAPVRFRPHAEQDTFMNRTVMQFVRDEDAQDLIEYALLAALLAVACIAGILELTKIKDFFARAGQALAGAI